MRSHAGRRLSLSALRVDDAEGAVLPAHFVTTEAGYRIIVDDAQGVYPIIIDPLLTESFDTEFESNQIGARLGSSVAAAGDVNGDGYADVIVGAPNYNSGQTDEGAAFLFLDGDTPGRLALPRQLRDDGSGTPIQPLGRAESADSFRVELIAQSPRGRERGKLEVETCSSSVAFGDPGCTLQRSPSWIDLALAPGGVVFEETIGGLITGRLYRWRARILYAPFAVTEPGITPPANPRAGVWRRVQAQAVEGDVRMFVPEPGGRTGRRVPPARRAARSITPTRHFYFGLTAEDAA